MVFPPRRGIKLKHCKNTSSMQAVRIEKCDSVILPMKQHIGAPCVPCVKPGDLVLAGQPVGRAEAPVSAPVHASISGIVQEPEVIRLPSGEDVQAVVIASDGEMNCIETSPPQVHSLEDFLSAVQGSGLVGLGGGGFPTHAKLRSAAGVADILLINAAECEPYITVDHREILDSGEHILKGIEHICKWLGIKVAIIGIEDNKADAIAHMRDLCGSYASSPPRIQVEAMPSRYPQGAEKTFVHALTGRVVPLGKLPHDVGALVMNVSSVAFLSRYMETGMPLISRTITVDGGAISRPMNVRVPIGIRLQALCEFCGVKEPPARIILGGPMMGVAAPDMDVMICKYNNAVLLFTKEQTRQKKETACIRCGACVSACPMGLAPFRLAEAYDARDAESLEALSIGACVECGSCCYVCPAGRNPAQSARMGKSLLRKAEQKEARQKETAQQE